MLVVYCVFPSHECPDWATTLFIHPEDKVAEIIDELRETLPTQYAAHSVT
ncbi:hypothetical protein PC117_g7918 [Phytophthora cactorum]|uniref:Uncharacterized protein n=1 Tax=Phytophthora cactorum TaxID=29920 RepID=A0A8T1E1W4_9STRA|nr:hypothetical protein PC117_g7918 [Phytophthora cactorum]